MVEKPNEMKFEAKTLEMALKQAASHFGLENTDSIEYRIVSQTKGGILSFLGRKVEIAVAPPSERKSEHNPSRRSRSSSEKAAGGAAKFKSDEMTPLSEKDCEELRKQLFDFCEGIVKRMFGDSVTVEATSTTDRFVLNICGEDIPGHLARNTKTAEALEHVIRKMPRHLRRELPFRVFVDINDNRQKREKELQELACDLAEKVHENKRRIVLNYKNSYDRKIIHMALDKDGRVYTKSIGSGSNRKLMILPQQPKDAKEASSNH